jgi:hypothetical protein
MAKRRQVNIYINGREINKTINGIRGEAKKLNRELAYLEIGSAEYNQKMKELKQLNGILGDHRKRLRGVDSVWKKMRGGIAAFAGAAAAAFTADAIVSYGTELFKLGTEMEVLTRKAETVFGDALPQVTQQAEANANAMGLTASQYTDAAAAIGDLLIPMGFMRTEAADISTQLVDLSGALAEWSGGQRSAEEVTKILGKAILGEREQLKELGISIQEADVKAALAEKGLQNLTGEMLQQAKAAVTLELITAKSADAQAAFAENSDTLIRKQAELNAKFRDIQENLAQALIPVFNRLLDAAAPVIESVADFIINLVKGEKPTGRFAELMNVLGTAVKNLGQVLLIPFKLFRAFGDFLINNFAGTLEFIGVQWIKFQNFLVKGVNGISELLNLKIELETVDLNEYKRAFQSIIEARQQSGVDTPISVTPGRSSGSSRQRTGPSLNVLNESGAEDAGAADKRTEALKKEFDRLEKTTQQFREKARLARLEEDERRLEEIRQRYDKQIELAQELEEKQVEGAKEKRLELERLKEEELQAQREEIHQKNLEEIVKREEEVDQLQAEIDEERRQAKLEVDEFILTDRELEVQALQQHFERLLNIAREYGLDTTAITEEYRRRQAEINQKFNEQEVQQKLEKQQLEIQSVSKGFQDISNLTNAFTNIATAAGERGSAAAKSFSLITLLAKSGEAIASATASGAKLPFPANLAAIASGVATVFANIAQARAILSEADSVPQRATGGYFNVMGNDDGRVYRAQYIGRRKTGMLPNRPVVLASEGKGAEYFVANEDLRNPLVLNYVQAIENIRKARLGIQQFAEGGFNLPPGAGNPQNISGNIPANTGISREDFQIMLKLLMEIRDASQTSIAVIPDRTIEGLLERIRKLQKVSGGVL